MLVAARAADGVADQLIAGLVRESLVELELNERERALLRYADRLTLDPAAINSDDIETLREAGLDDRAIHDTCAIVSYYAFVNRMADGLGVELES